MRSGSLSGRVLGLLRALAVLAVVGAAAAGCTGAAAPRPTARAIAPGATITWAVDAQPTSYNPDTTADVPANTPLLGGVLGGFWHHRPDGSVARDPAFGTYQKINDDPLTVRYTIDRRAVWSDGAPIDCDDVALAWLANSGVTGERGFASRHVARYREMNRPRCEAEDKVFTVSYRTPTADWETAFGPGTGWLLPAHVVAREAHLRGTFVDYLDTPTSPELAPAIAFWNTGWAFTPGQVRKDLVLSSGPYLVDAWVAGTSITLRPNPLWWGVSPATGTIVLAFLPPEQQVEALGAGRVQVIDPEPDPAVMAGLKALGARVRVTTGYRYGFEHLDFNLRGGFADRTLREAFARCVPRRQIVDKLIKPVVPDARIMESRLAFPFQPDYASFEEPGRPYDTVDLEGARRLLAGRKPTVRVGWRKDPEQVDTARLATVALLKASCGRAGFTVVDAGTPTFLTREWPGGGYDVALLSWTGAAEVTGHRDIYTSDGASNLGGYRNADVDRLFARLAGEPDRLEQVALLRKIDALLWQDVATLPLFAYPAVTATSVDVAGIVFNPDDTDLAWNLGEWTRT